MSGMWRRASAAAARGTRRARPLTLRPRRADDAARPVVGTHSGTFHCDEALACFMLRQTAQFRDARVVRSRDPEVLAGLAAVVDVGGEYDPSRHRYDHHQRGFEETFDAAHSVKLSSAGLVYKHFGREVVAALTGLGQGSAELEAVYAKTYDSFVQEIDGIDNGVNVYPDGHEPAYRVTTNLSSRVGRLNPAWNEEAGDAAVAERFERAVALTGAEFSASLLWARDVWLSARAIVASSVEKRFAAHPSGQVVVLDRFTVWGDHLHELERELALPAPVVYVIFEDGRDGSFRVRAVSEAPGSFVSRKALPEPWRGLRGLELRDKSGVDGCVFVHASGFIGGNLTKEGALEMARRALEM